MSVSKMTIPVRLSCCINYKKVSKKKDTKIEEVAIKRHTSAAKRCLSATVSSAVRFRVVTYVRTNRTGNEKKNVSSRKIREKEAYVEVVDKE